ncbi:metallophosphoesterase family protein [Deinococcus peraridilitoris]|uniref:Calcineurin-like phosphoesterase n=1 Tax=Deinococcus peraridilitoris (strain DSM 19664 / LMG 22246 / CIP 109416 / KR-200) TaxID=937777 RepID=L0A1E1_DEIPD|nr:metallophosphoesterase [Deinococcus peraridilitoris]AFZ67636.1 Calcineurin-like phosphoesterase [Deinococcus peraridilitoris DSM 19664]
MKQAPVLWLLGVLLLTSALAAAPSTPAQTGRFRAVILSDFNGPYGSTSYPAPLARVMTRTLNEWQPDLFLSAGDVIAAQKRSLTDMNVRAMWRAFDQQVAGPLRRADIPFAFAVGNHDGSSARAGGQFSFARDRQLLARYWNTPGKAPPLDFVDRSRFPFAFTFTFGGMFFAVVDASSHDLQDRTWLEMQLASSAAQAAPMRMVIGHLPLYAVGMGRAGSGNVLAGAESLRAMLERYRVHTYVSGHHAAYYPARRGGLNLLATGGIGARDLLGFPGTARSTVTVADFDVRAGIIRLSTFDVETGRRIDEDTLPARLGSGSTEIERVRKLR